MSDTIVLLSASVGPTLVGAAALVQATRSRREAAGANRAVNHQDAGQPTLMERVQHIDRRTIGLVDEATTLTSGLADCAEAVDVLGHKLDGHLAYHEVEREARGAERRRDIARDPKGGGR